ncbi:hypothetical protein FRB90_012186 [Tulasnella sp. 427]|nr:hypothetical protein FRB90_012186 [Tulasnella sp. 427]
MRTDPFQTDDEAWTEAEPFSDEEYEEQYHSGAGWQASPGPSHAAQSLEYSRTYPSGPSASGPNHSSSSVHSQSSSSSSSSSRSWGEDSTPSHSPTPPPTVGDLKITFESEDGQNIWVEPASLFIEDSPQFYKLVRQDIGAETLNADPIDSLPNLERHPNRQLRRGLGERLKYRLIGVTPFDFESLLLGLKPKLGQEIPYERLCPLLVLATDWGFEAIRKYSINALSQQDDLPVPRILLARRTRVPEWLPDA